MTSHRIRAWLTLIAAVVLTGTARARPAAPSFIAHTIATGLSGGYQVVVSDLNRDLRPDIIAVDSGLNQLRWYENPGWKPHVLMAGIEAPINASAYDVDGDGIPEIALAHGFATEYASSSGIVSI